MYVSHIYGKRTITFFIISILEFYFNEIIYLGKKLARGISRATDNENIVDRVRSECALDVAINTNPNIDQFYIETPEYTFTLPDITIYSEEFR